jgi:integrase-like protein
LTSIPAPLQEYIEEALKTRGPYLFPNATGDRHPEGTGVEKVLRRALGRAGIVTGYIHKCRRCAARGEPYHEEAKDADERRCSRPRPAALDPNAKCGMRLWASPQPVQMKFHELRHSTNTLLVRLGVPDRIIQKIIGHLNRRMTDRYTHLDVEDMRAALTKVSGQGMTATPTAPMEVLAPNDCYDTAKSVNANKKAPKPGKFSWDFGAVVGAEHRVRTGDLRLGNEAARHSRCVTTLHG